VKRWRATCRFALSVSVVLLGMSSGHVRAAPAEPIVDLGDSQARVLARLGKAQRVRAVAMCPTHRIELRRRGSLWLKLVYGPDDRLRAAGVFRLAQSGGRSGRVQPPAALRWTGLAPGMDGRSGYPEPAAWRPLLWTIGAKQWLWMETSEQAAGPSARERFLGGVVVDEASGFAAGVDFPHDVAEAVVAANFTGSDLIEAEFARPLLAWRRRTPPNAYIEALPDSPAQPPHCGAVTLVMPGYADFLPASR